MATAQIAQTVQRFMPSVGNADCAPNISSTAFQKLGTTLTQTNTVTLALSKPLTGGLLRLRFYTPGSADVTFQALVEVTDGTSNSIVAVTPTMAIGATTVGGEVCFVAPWLTELTAIATVSAQITVGGTTKTGTVDLEFFGN
jgi:hypothetical protein